MEEGHPPALGALPDPGLQDLGAGLLGALEGLLEAFDPKAHVVESRTLSVQEPAHRAVLGERLQQLDAAGPLAEEGHADALAGNFFAARGLFTQQGGPERHRLVQRVDRHGEVIDVAHALIPSPGVPSYGEQCRRMKVWV